MAGAGNSSFLTLATTFFVSTLLILLILVARESSFFDLRLALGFQLGIEAAILPRTTLPVRSSKRLANLILRSFLRKAVLSLTLNEFILPSAKILSALSTTPPKNAFFIAFIT